MVSVCPLSYGCTPEVAKHERSLRAARSDSLVRLQLLQKIMKHTDYVSFLAEVARLYWLCHKVS